MRHVSGLRIGWLIMLPLLPVWVAFSGMHMWLVTLMVFMMLVTVRM